MHGGAEDFHRETNCRSWLTLARASPAACPPLFRSFRIYVLNWTDDSARSDRQTDIAVGVFPSFAPFHRRLLTRTSSQKSKDFDLLRLRR